MMTGPPLNSSTEVNTGEGVAGACLSFTGIWKCSDVSFVPIVAFTSPKDWSSSMMVNMTFYKKVFYGSTESLFVNPSTFTISES